MATDSIPQKQCYKCKRCFPATREYFSPTKANKDGLKGTCKSCLAAEYHERKIKDPDGYEQYRKRKRELRIEQRQAPDFNEKRRAKRNLKRENEVRSIRRANDPEYKERTNKGTRERRAANPDYWRLKNRIYSAKRRSQMGTEHYTNADIDLQYKSQNGKCWHCGKKLNGKYHIDHLIALSRGGTDKATNIVISCRECNESKHNKMTWEWNGKLL